MNTRTNRVSKSVVGPDTRVGATARQKVDVHVCIPASLYEEFCDRVYMLYGYRHGNISKALIEAIEMWIEETDELLEFYNEELNKALIKAIEEAMQEQKKQQRQG